MTDSEFVQRVKRLSDMSSDYLEEEKKELALLICVACDTEERTGQIEDFLSKDGITFEMLIDFVESVLPDVEIVEDETEDE